MKRRSKLQFGASAYSAILIVLVMCSTLFALGHSPFRLEGAYVYPSRVDVSGMADITRWLAVRVNLLSASWSGDSSLRDFGVEGGSGFSTFEEAGLVLSPWRKKFRIQPYAFGGIGASFADHDNLVMAIETRTLTLQGSYGLGVEPLLFFLPEAPVLFLEIGEVFGGSITGIIGLPQLPNPLWPKLGTKTRIAVGIRL